MQEELLGCFKNIFIHLNEKEQKTFEMLSQKLNDEYAENDLYAVTLSAILLLISHAQKRYKNETSISHRLQSQMPEKVKIVLSYIEENFASIKSIDEIARHAYLNKSYLCRLFKKETSMTVMDYLYDYRILQACEMLTGTDSSVSEIALLCGFENTSHFIKTFKSMLDSTPGKFRKKNK
jgi:AraC-like DNA-binding protein